MLISRGPVYKSAASAGESDDGRKWHANCVVPPRTILCCAVEFAYDGLRGMGCLLIFVQAPGRDLRVQPGNQIFDAGGSLVAAQPGAKSHHALLLFLGPLFFFFY